MASNFTAICWMGMRKIRQFLPLCVRLLLPDKRYLLSLLVSRLDCLISLIFINILLLLDGCLPQIILAINGKSYAWCADV